MQNKLVKLQLRALQRADAFAEHNAKMEELQTRLLIAIFDNLANEETPLGAQSMHLLRDANKQLSTKLDKIDEK